MSKDYTFMTMEEFIAAPAYKKTIVLRHDVDEKPHNALKIAKAEYDLGLKATYYFRIVKISNDSSIIKAIAALGHEIGYHYEDYASAVGDLDKAIFNFTANLAYFRTFYPVKTVCMHGSSMSDYDNRTMWKYYSLSDFGIIGEPYISIDYKKVFYLTDTGMCWDGNKYSVRDFVKNYFGLSYHRSSDIIKAVRGDTFPTCVVLQSHTLWTDSFFEWFMITIREFLRIRIKMFVVKYPRLKEYAYKLIKKYST